MNKLLFISRFVVIIFSLIISQDLLLSQCQSPSASNIYEARIRPDNSGTKGVPQEFIQGGKVVFDGNVIGTNYVYIDMTKHPDLVWEERLHIVVKNGAKVGIKYYTNPNNNFPNYAKLKYNIEVIGESYLAIIGVKDSNRRSSDIEFGGSIFVDGASRFLVNLEGDAWDPGTLTYDFVRFMKRIEVQDDSYFGVFSCGDIILQSGIIRAGYVYDENGEGYTSSVCSSYDHSEIDIFCKNNITTLLAIQNWIATELSLIEIYAQRTWTASFSYVSFRKYFPTRCELVQDPEYQNPKRYIKSKGIFGATKFGGLKFADVPGDLAGENGIDVAQLLPGVMQGLVAWFNNEILHTQIPQACPGAICTGSKSIDFNYDRDIDWIVDEAGSAQVNTENSNHVSAVNEGEELSLGVEDIDMNALDKHVDKQVIDFISLTPNPTTARFTLTAPSDELENGIQIFSTSGQIGLINNIPVTNVNDTTREIDLSGLPNGVYAVKTKTQAQRIVLMK